VELTTVGHGTASEDDFGHRLQVAKVGWLVDVRIAPGSRRNPHLGRDALERWLPRYGVGYRWDKRLGGFRKVSPESPDVALRNDSFRGYAAHMRTAEFLSAMDELLADVAGLRTTVMCSESVWWRCHRRMVADFAQLARGVPVRHLMPDGRFEAHRPTEGVRLRDDGLLVYDGGQAPLDEAPDQAALDRATRLD
jgi:uncharacterized protein (DUF488 family)